MLLAIDIGNSSINMGIFQGPRLLRTFRIPTEPKKSTAAYNDEILASLARMGINVFFQGVILSSVVPEITGVMQAVARDLSTREPITVSISQNSGLDFDVENPHEIGTDRIANVVAARETLGSPCLVVDFGTATTITACKEKTFIGGAIVPGIGLMAETLHRGTSKLPLIDIGLEMSNLDSRLPSLGKSTIRCIISGIIYGTVGAVERLIHEMESEEACSFKVVITGGYARIIAPFLNREFRLEPDLTLEGLRLLYERNS